MTKKYIKGSGKTGMTQMEYLNSDKNPIHSFQNKRKGGLANKGKTRLDLTKMNKEPWFIELRREGQKKSNKMGIGFKRLNNDINFIKKRLKALMTRPTKPEKILIDLINHNNLPYKYVGDGEVIIGRKNPDFINCNGKKKVIELFSWHHSSENKGLRWQSTEFGTKAIYSQYGFKTLIIWQSELENINKILIKIKKFDGGD